MRIFVLFILCFFSFIFFPFGFLVWKFDVLFVDLLVFVFSYGHSKQTRSILLLVHGVQSVTLIMGFIHGQRIFFSLRTAEVKASFRPIH